METINAKDLRVVHDDEMTWLVTEDNKIVVFPTPQSFLEALVENGLAKERFEENLIFYASELKGAINTLGGMKNVVRFIHDEAGDVNLNKLKELPDVTGVLFNFVGYCITSGTYTEEVTKYILDEIFYSTQIEQNMIGSNCRGYVFVDKEAKDTIWFMDNEYSIGYEIVLYKLSLSEQEELKKQMENSDTRLCENELYVKGVGLLLEEIIEKFE